MAGLLVISCVVNAALTGWLIAMRKREIELIKSCRRANEENYNILTERIDGIDVRYSPTNPDE